MEVSVRAMARLDIVSAFSSSRPSSERSPKWYSDGIYLLKGLAQTAIEREFMLAKLNLLEHARKKTTQKVSPTPSTGAANGEMLRPFFKKAGLYIK